MAEHADLLASVGLCVSVAAVLAFIAHRLRQPLLLAYLLAGVLIGPQLGLSLVDDQKSIETVAEIGLILLLFIIGLELDMHKLLAAGKPVLVTGILQFPLCVALALGFFLLVGAGAAAGGFGLPYLAVCLAMSSTMVVVKLLYDKFELDTLPGRITLGVLVFQDIWAMVVLGVQPNLLNPELGTLLASLGKGALLVVASFLISKTVLPRVFRSVAKVPELVLVGSLAWCFIVAAAASAAGLSREMGALIAGVSISTFPYNMDVVAKVISVRDFFVTLFFVALGMQIPVPTWEVVGFALMSSAFLMLSRFAVVFPILHALGMGHRASLLPAVNLAQMSEFSLVIATIGVTYQHIGRETVSVLIFVFAFTAVASTYMIDYSHWLQERLTEWLRSVGVKDLDALAPEGTPPPTHAGKDVVLLGFFVEASALVHEYELGAVGGRHPVLDRLLVIDFNPQVHTELNRRGIACLYGDVSHMETLRHAEIQSASLVVSTIPDSILKGTDNRRMLKQARRVSPRAKVIVTANRAPAALELYEAGADYVFVSSLHSSAWMASVVEQGLQRGFDELRAQHIEQLRRRHEVLA